MPVVVVKFFAHVENLANQREIELRVSPDLRQAITAIECSIGQELTARIGQEFVILCNGRHVEVSTEVVLKDGDQIAFVPMFVGG